MNLENAVDHLRRFYDRPGAGVEKLKYVVFPVKPYPVSPGKLLAEELSDMEPIVISLPETLRSQLSEKAWEKLLVNERSGDLEVYVNFLERVLHSKIEDVDPGKLIILSGLELLRLIPVNVTGLAVLAREKTVIAPVKGTLEEYQVRVLGVGPTLAVPPHLPAPIAVEVEL